MTTAHLDDKLYILIDFEDSFTVALALAAYAEHDKDASRVLQRYFRKSANIWKRELALRRKNAKLKLVETA